MKKTAAFILAVFLCMATVGCTIGKNTGEKEENRMFTFEKSEDADKVAYSSQVAHFIEGFPADYSRQCVLVRGKLLTLFGAPLYETADLENQYSYVVRAVGKEGQEYFLNVYHGPTGPAIGGNNSAEGIQEAATELIAKINAAPAADFHYEGYYPDTCSKITMSIQNGEVYYEETLITDPAEIELMFEQIRL